MAHANNLTSLQTRVETRDLHKCSIIETHSFTHMLADPMYGVYYCFGQFLLNHQF